MYCLEMSAYLWETIGNSLLIRTKNKKTFISNVSTLSNTNTMESKFTLP